MKVAKVKLEKKHMDLLMKGDIIRVKTPEGDEVHLYLAMEVRHKPKPKTVMDEIDDLFKDKKPN